LIQNQAYLTRPALLQPVLAGVTVCFILLLTITDRIGIYMACIFGVCDAMFILTCNIV
jgi:hypothetical protein